MISKQIDLNELAGYRIHESLQERFPWANDCICDAVITDAAILINSLMLAMENGADDAALMVMAGRALERHEQIADAKDLGSKKEREICKTICRELADRRLEDACCMASLHRAERAIDSRNNPS